MFVEYSCQKMSLVSNEKMSLVEKAVGLSKEPVDNKVETVELTMAPADSTTPGMCVCVCVCAVTHALCVCTCSG